MSHTQRHSDRRRRVLYTSAVAENEVSTAASRRNALLLREARNPTAAYASRVQRRIRGRWFSLVPVSRRNMSLVAFVLWSLSFLLVFAHYAAVTWPSLTLESNLAVARPLRLDRPDSFGRWFMSLLLAGAAGVSLLIYQLRRYRIDDFQGHYRVWRLVIVLCCIASVDSLVSVMDWAGALLDLGVGRRVALSGDDWVSILVAVGGAVLAMRMIAEVRRSRWSLITMIIGWSLLAIPVAGKWNIVEVNSLFRWTLVTTAPLLAITTLFLSVVGYLRLLYREVRRVEDSISLSFRLPSFSSQVFGGDEGEPESVQADEEPKRRWWHRREKSVSDDSSQKPTRAELREAARLKAAAEKASKVAKQAEAAAKKVVAEAAKEAKQAVAMAEVKETSEPAAKRRWLGLRAAKTETAKRETAELEPEGESKPTVALKAPKPAGEQQVTENKRSGLSGWFGKKKSSESQESGGNVASEDETHKHVGSQLNRSPGNANTNANADDDDDQSGDDTTDYSGMSKAERRRLRKLQRRGGNAA